jgi:hypothetical protein
MKRSDACNAKRIFLRHNARRVWTSKVETFSEEPSSRTRGIHEDSRENGARLRYIDGLDPQIAD